MPDVLLCVPFLAVQVGNVCVSTLAQLCLPGFCLLELL